MAFGWGKKDNDDKKNKHTPVIKELQTKFGKSYSEKSSWGNDASLVAYENEIGEMEFSAGDKKNSMAGFLQDMQNSKTKNHRSLKRFFTKEDSKEYSDVKEALGNVVTDTTGNFSSDTKKNSEMLSSAAKNYHKLITACQTYLNKGGGKSDSGKARKEKVAQILELAMLDYESVKTLSYRVRSMSVEEQSTLNWQEILQEARTINLEVDDLKNFKALGANMKTGEAAGRLIPGKGVFTKEQKFNASDMVKELTEDYKDNFISIGYNEGKEEDFAKSVEGGIFHQSNRNVATSRVANLLGIGGIVEQSSTVKVKEKSTGNVTKGNLMTLAKGEAAASIANSEIYENMKKMGNIQDRIDKAGELFAPSVQKELCSLQVLDYICGQTDRHANNFFLEKDGSERYAHVHAIDNDMSFGTGVDLGKLVAETGDYARKRSMRMVVDGEGNLAIPHMDRQLAMNIKNLSPDELKFALEDLIEPAFITAAVERLKIVQDAIRKEESKKDSKVFVENDAGWGKATHEALIQSTGAMKIKQADTAAKGYEEYFKAAGYLDDKEQKYETFRQNGYYGEYMLSVMAYHDHNRKFERE